MVLCDAVKLTLYLPYICQFWHVISYYCKWHVMCIIYKYRMIKVGTRPMGTFYVKYTYVFHTQGLADVWRVIPILQTSDNNLTSFIVQSVTRRRAILGSNNVQSVILDSLCKVTNFILSKSSVVYYVSKKQHQACIHQ